MKQILTALLILFFVIPAHASIQRRINLDVPIVAQGKMLCGPATIEMLFRYWGVHEYDQYDIATSMLYQFKTLNAIKNPEF